MAAITERRVNSSLFENVKRNHVLVTARKLSKNCCARANGKQMLDIPSLSFTEVGVGLFANAFESSSNQRPGKLNMQYASRISRSVGVSPCSLMLALIYIERIRSKDPDYLRHVSSCDVFIVSLMVASKFLFDDGEDQEVFNEEWAQRSNIDIKKLNKLEREFLCAIDWNVFVEPAQFFDVFTFIDVMAVQNECRKRSWNGLNYDELILLLDYHNLNTNFKSNVFDIFMKIVGLCAVTYVAIIVCVAASVVTISMCQRLLVSQSLSVQQSSVNSSQLIDKTLMSTCFQPFAIIEPKFADKSDRAITKNNFFTHVPDLKCSQNFIL